MARRRSDLEEIRRGAYKLQRGIGTFQAYQRGGLGTVVLRLARRKTRTAAGRASKGWL